MTGIATRTPNILGIEKAIDKIVDKRPNASQGGGGLRTIDCYRLMEVALGHLI